MAPFEPLSGDRQTEIVSGDDKRGAVDTNHSKSGSGMRDLPCISFDPRVRRPLGDIHLHARAISTTPAAPRLFVTRLPIFGLALVAATAVIAPPTIGAWSPDAVGQPAGVQASTASPVPIGDLLAGNFKDATGHSAQSHLVYAVNSRTWWFFTLTSMLTRRGIESGREGVPVVGSGSRDRDMDCRGRQSARRGGKRELVPGRRPLLGIAYLNNSPSDVIHADISMAFDGQDGRTGHVRAIVTGTSITWASWKSSTSPPPPGRCPREHRRRVQWQVHSHRRADSSTGSGRERPKVRQRRFGGAWVSGFSVPP